MKWLKPLILKVGKKPIDLARHLGLPPTRVYEMQRGKRQFQPREIPLAAAFLKLALRHCPCRQASKASR